MIRINLLPRAQRRRRLRLRREVVSLSVMLLGWLSVIVFGYGWIAGHTARAAEYRAATAAEVSETRQLEKKRDNPALAERQRVLKIRQEGLSQLRAERQTLAEPLTRLAALLRPGDEATPAGGDPGSASASEALRVLELRATAAASWRVDGVARDVAALADLVRRVRADGAFHLAYGPEYARTEDGRLRFRVDLRVGAQP
ncbi:MAG TPA: hypothetical protein VIK91_02050 [Nannocystis sp.]